MADQTIILFTATGLGDFTARLHSVASASQIEPALEFSEHPTHLGRYEAVRLGVIDAGDFHLMSEQAGAFFDSPPLFVRLKNATGIYVATSFLPSLLDGLGGTALAGPFTVTVTVTDGSNAIEGALVRIHKPGSSESKLTNPSGVATFTVISASWSVSVTAAGFDGETVAVTVGGDDSVTVVMEESSLPPLTGVPVEGATVRLWVGESGVPVSHEVIDDDGNPIDLSGRSLLLAVADTTGKLLQGTVPSISGAGNNVVTWTVAQSITMRPTTHNWSLRDLTGGINDVVQVGVVKVVQAP